MNELISLSKLFNDSIFRIPDYQRGYAWKESQLKDFWDDLYNLNGKRYHYTGMLSLKELNSNQTNKWEDEQWLLDEYKAYHVVDGQQRLTTFMILLTSIINCAIKHEHDSICNRDINDIIKKYIVVQNKPNGILKTYIFGYEKDNPSFEYLRYKIFGEGSAPTTKETFYTLNLKFAKDFFDNKISELYANKGYKAVEELYLKLTTKLQFNIHDIKDDFDVFVAFETMNNRGKKLSNLEILKNRLIYLTTIYEDDILSLYEKDKLRKTINEAWSEVYYQLGRNQFNPLVDDDFLKNHWTMYFKYSRTTGDDYINFLLNKHFSPKCIYGEKVNFEFDNTADELYDLNNLLDSEDETLYPIEIEKYVLSLQEVAPYWYYSFNPNDCKEFTLEEKTLVSKLNRVGIAYFRTLVVASFINKNVTSEERIELFSVIEKFIFLCFRMARYQSSYLSNKAYDYARDLMKNEIDINSIISFFKEKIEENKKDAIQAFSNNMNRYFKNYDGYYSWSELKYVLFEYEAELAKGKAVKHLDDWEYFTKSEKDKVSIEHMFPQKPTKLYWLNKFKQYQDETERKYLTNSLGNLLALSQSINSSLQNDDFESKKNPSNGRAGYSKGSLSEIEVATEYIDWTPQTILERGLKLLSFMENRWDFKFPNEEFKISLLGLTFLLEERAEVPDIEEVDYSYRDVFFKGEKSEIKVSEYLKNKDLYMIEYYFKIFNALKVRIPSLYETATKNYIALRCSETSKNLAEIHIQNSKRKICIITKSPSNEGYTIGEKLPENFLWSLDYRIYLKEDEKFTEVLDVIYEAYNNRINSNIIENEVDDQFKQIQIMRTADFLKIIKDYEQKGVLEILHSDNRYIRFTTPIMRTKVGLLGDGSWGHIEDLFVYEINNRLDDALISLYIGPALEENREKWVNWAKNNPVFKVTKGQKWTPIYRVSLFKEDDSEAIEILVSFMNNVVPMIDEQFKNK